MSQDKDDRKYYRDYNDKNTKKDNTPDRDRDRNRNRNRNNNSTKPFSHYSSQLPYYPYSGSHPYGSIRPENLPERHPPKSSHDPRHPDDLRYTTHIPRDVREQLPPKNASEDLRQRSEAIQVNREKREVRDCRETRTEPRHVASETNKQKDLLSTRAIIEILIGFVRNKTDKRLPFGQIEKFKTISSYDEFCDHLEHLEIAYCADVDLKEILVASFKVGFYEIAMPLFRELTEKKLLTDNIIKTYIHSLFRSDYPDKESILEVFRAAVNFLPHENLKYYTEALKCIFTYISRGPLDISFSKIHILLTTHDELNKNDQMNYYDFLSECKKTKQNLWLISKMAEKIFNFAAEKEQLNPTCFLSYIKLLEEQDLHLEIIKVYEKYYKKNYLESASEKKTLLEENMGTATIKYMFALCEIEFTMKPDFILMEAIFKHTINKMQLNISSRIKSYIAQHFLRACIKYENLKLFASGSLELIENQCYDKEKFTLYIAQCKKIKSDILAKEIFKIFFAYSATDIGIVNKNIWQAIRIVMWANLPSEVIKLWRFVIQHKNDISIEFYLIRDSINYLDASGLPDVVDEIKAIVKFGLEFYPSNLRIKDLARRYSIELAIKPTLSPSHSEISPTTLPENSDEFESPVLIQEIPLISDPQAKKNIAITTITTSSSPITFSPDNASKKPINDRLMEAIQYQQIDKIQKLISQYKLQGHDINAIQKIKVPAELQTQLKRKTPGRKRKYPKLIDTTFLMAAVESGSLAAVKLLIENDADITKTPIEKNGKTVLYAAVENNFFEMVKYLIQTDTKKALKDSPPVSGCTLMHAAVRTENIELVKTLYAYGVKIDVERKGRKHSAYSYSAILESKDIKQFFDEKLKKTSLPDCLSLSAGDEKNKSTESRRDDFLTDNKFSASDDSDDSIAAERAYYMADSPSRESSESDFDADAFHDDAEVEEEKILRPIIEEDIENNKKRKRSTDKKNQSKNFNKKQKISTVLAQSTSTTSTTTATSTFTTTTPVLQIPRTSPTVSADPVSGYLNYQSTNKVVQNPYFGTGINLTSSSSSLGANTENIFQDDFDFEYYTYFNF